MLVSDHFPADHIDLLVTAALRFGVIQSPDGVVRPAAHAKALAQRVGSMLWIRTGGCGGYVFRPVKDSFDPVEVVKACHAVESVCGAEWAGSMEQRVVAALVKAASLRVDGYSAAPWMWTRPTAPIGFCLRGQSVPGLEGLEWVTDVDELREVWQSAAHVVVTSDAVPLLPAELVDRPRVHVLVIDPDRFAHAVVAAHECVYSHATVVLWPDGAGWLGEQLAS